MGISTVTRNYQVTLPKDIRVSKGIKIGDTVLFVLEGDEIKIVTKSREEVMRDARGIWKGKESSVEYVRKIRAGWGRRAKRLGLR